MAEDGQLDPEELTRIRSGIRIMALRSLRDAEAADEAAQETMTRLLDALRRDRIEDRAKLAAFARGIANHVIVDMQRAGSRTVTLQPAAFDARPAAATDPLSELITRAEAARVRAALAELEPADRELLRLSFFEGRSPAEIAESLGEPPARIRKRKSRALARLRTAFTAGGHADPAAPTYERDAVTAFAATGRTR